MLFGFWSDFFFSLYIHCSWENDIFLNFCTDAQSCYVKVKKNHALGQTDFFIDTFTAHENWTFFNYFTQERSCSVEFLFKDLLLR